MIVFITGASSGFGRMSAEALARKGHTVYASMRGTTSRNADKVAEFAEQAERGSIDLRAIECDVGSQEPVDQAVARIVGDHGRVDVVMHNAGHMVQGPAEAFTPEQLAEQYDVNVLSTQRVNRAVLPHMRAAREGLLIWNSSSSVAGGTPPFLAPYFAAKAAMDSLAISYARELALWGVETSILVPGAFTRGTNHFAHAGRPEDEERADAYERGAYAGYADKASQAFAEIVPEDADPALVAQAVVDIVEAPRGRRPFRVVVDPTGDGADVTFAVMDRVKREMLHRMGLSELIAPRVTG